VTISFVTSVSRVNYSGNVFNCAGYLCSVKWNWRKNTLLQLRRFQSVQRSNMHVLKRGNLHQTEQIHSQNILNKYTLRTLFDISSRETLFRWSFLFQCLFYLLSDGRKEPVYFDKITGRIEALCYGLDMNYVDPVSVYTCIFIMMKERGILFHINFSLIYILMNVFLKVKFIITYKIVRLREMRYCIYFLLYFSLTVCDCT